MLSYLLPCTVRVISLVTTPAGFSTTHRKRAVSDTSALSINKDPVSFTMYLWSDAKKSISLRSFLHVTWKELFVSLDAKILLQGHVHAANNRKICRLGYRVYIIACQGGVVSNKTTSVSAGKRDERKIVVFLAKKGQVTCPHVTCLFNKKYFCRSHSRSLGEVFLLGTLPPWHVGAYNL